jgi:hypothetical protein
MRKLWISAAALVLASCGAAKDMSAAGDQVTAFHRAYDAGNYDALWNAASPRMKEVTPRQQLVELMGAFHERLGKVKSTKRTGFFVNYATGGSQVTLTYETKFANGDATETFVYDTDDPPRLLGWRFFVPGPVDAPPPVQVVVQKPGKTATEPR